MKATVLMRQPGRVQEIVGALRRGGGDRLQVPGLGVRREGACPAAFPPTGVRALRACALGWSWKNRLIHLGEEHTSPNSQLSE